MLTRPIILAASTVVASLLALASPSLAANEIDAEYRAAVGQFLLVQRTPEAVAGQMTLSVAQQALTSIASSGITVTEPMQKVVVEVARETIGDRLGAIEYLTDVYAPLYAEHYSRKELESLIAFWESPLGKKTIDVMPAVMSGAVRSLEETTTEYLPEFQAAVDAGFEKEGILLAP